MTRTGKNSRTSPVKRSVVSVMAAALLAALLGLLAWQRPPPLPDFSTIDEIPARKQAFFEYLAPLVEAENHRVLEQRRRLLGITGRIRAGGQAGWLDRRWLGRLAEEYEVGWQPGMPAAEQLEKLDMLERRVDMIPVTLALVQAATESGWGQSRFARDANNLFGHWCFEPGCGLVPEQRNQAAGHEVAAFDSVTESVTRYMHNLNTHEAYAPLRAIRAQLRRQNRKPTAMALADGLVRYSERREDYVDEIKDVIEVNRPIIERVRQAL